MKIMFNRKVQWNYGWMLMKITFNRKVQWNYGWEINMHKTWTWNEVPIMNGYSIIFKIQESYNQKAMHLKLEHQVGAWHIDTFI